MNKYKERFAQETEMRTLAEAMVGADVFAGLSVKGAIDGDMIRPWPRIRLSSPWRILIRKSSTKKPRQAGRTSSLQRAVPTIPTRSTMFLDFPSFSAERLMCVRLLSTKR